MIRAALITVIFLLIPANHALLLDKPGTLTPQDKQLEQFLHSSVKWLETKANIAKYPLLNQYAELLQQVVQPACTHCVDYFQAVGLVRSLGKTIRAILADDRSENYYPVVRRSYVAAVWLLQRSRMFVWETTHLNSNTIRIMFRLYIHHVKRAQGRTISFHHISKCGGTTMCQLAATNRCSNPHLTVEKNCVMDDRLDSPIWMVSHEVNELGAFPNNVTGVLDVTPASEIDAATYNRHEYATEPTLSMWLMYSCPYLLNGKPYNCQARMADVKQSGTTFMANERTLSYQAGRAQVCPDFVNAIILRQPLTHAISLMAEAKFRYVRQLNLKNITSWEPPSWNLTWWEALGPALVGNYATRTLVGRHSFCRSATNMSRVELSQAVDSLLAFDVVMTLNRAKDIDLLTSSMLGWPARKFSSQPAKRVRVVEAPAAGLFSMRRLAAHVSSAAGGGKLGKAVASLQGMEPAMQGLGSRRALLTARGASSAGVVSPLVSEGSAEEQVEEEEEEDRGQGQWGGDDGEDAKYTELHSREADGDEDDEEEHEVLESSDEDFERAAAALDMPFEEAPPPPPPSPEEIAREGAAALVRLGWLERRAQQLGYPNISSAWRVLTEPKVFHIEAGGHHSAHKLIVKFNGTQEVWHAFPRHAFAFSEADMVRLEALTQLDKQLYELADFMLDLDAAWLRSIMQNYHYRKRLRSLSATYTACGFAGIIPGSDSMRNQLLF